MRIVTLDTFTPELDTLADAAPRATFYHTGTWLLSLADAYPRLALRSLVAEENGAATAYLPFFVSRRGPMQALWSLPFGTYGGPVGTADDVVLRALLEEYRAQAQRRTVVEVGWVDFDNAFADLGGEVEAEETHLVDISEGLDVVWRKQSRHRRKRRNADVRRAREEGVEVRRASGAEDIERFFALCRRRLQGRGASTVYPQQLFASLVERGGERVRIHLAWRGDEVVGGLLIFYYKDTAIAWHGMTSLEGSEIQAGKLLLATCLSGAADEGYRTFNLGASLGKASLIWFKESLGGEAHAYRTVRHRRFAARVAAALRRVPDPQ
jgi:CelD/BcsL family acetyltransferase involved in cellulose biosynthesis